MKQYISIRNTFDYTKYFHTVKCNKYKITPLDLQPETLLVDRKLVENVENGSTIHKGRHFTVPLLY